MTYTAIREAIETFVYSQVPIQETKLPTKEINSCFKILILLEKGTVIHTRNKAVKQEKTSRERERGDSRCDTPI